jgi:hypothetical protein
MSSLTDRTDSKLLPFTREHFTAWARMQPPEQVYHFWDCEGDCAMGQYMRAQGRKWDAKGVNYERSCDDVFGDDFDLPLRTHPQTFGALAQRLIDA